MILVDISVWIEILRDRSRRARESFWRFIGDEPYGLSRFTQLELLQGAKDKREWRLLDEYLSDQTYLQAKEETWRKAARIYFELRRKGVTLTSPVDCCIAQIALDEKALLLHRDRDFEKSPLSAPFWLRGLKWFDR
jgi:predicted nucleic acid-binding protein